MKFCGECGKRLHVIYEDVHKRFLCKECHITYYENPKPCVTAVIISESKLLLSKRLIDPGKNKWDFIGGFLEKGEHPEQGLKREVKEELDVDLSAYHYFGIYMDRYGDQDSSILNIVYLCKINSQPKINTKEFSEISWFEISELPDEFAFDSMSDIIQDYKKYLDL